ncbi:MAG TPA: hypothetical protein DCE78_13515 [Bacteroidetes bacterium]|nr:hypothetical protein [Bacteroidota bacterium]
MTKTKIEWTDYSWNPVTGCTKISDGCKNCYAERIAKRFWNRPFEKVWCHPERLADPSMWKKPKKIFVCSMSDLFHTDVPDDFIEQVFYTMALNARQHTYMILTKRPARMLEFMNGHHECVQSHVWLGVSAENQEMADERIPILLQTPAVVRFVSVEPMLEKIDLVQAGALSVYVSGGGVGDYPLSRGLESNGISWVICGAESGHGARPFDMCWARDLKNQCQSAGVPFFLKQARINGQLLKMPELDGQIWEEYPV